MDHQLLKEFVILSETGSFSNAAEKLHVSQSTLSRHIQMLEKELCKPLLVRTTRRMALTDFGSFLIPYARKAVEAQDELSGAIQRWEHEENDILRIGCSFYSHLYMLTEAVIAFRKKYPNIQVRTVEKPMSELNEDFLKGSLNLITMAYPSSHRRPENMVVNGRGRMVAVVPKTNVLSTYEVLSIFRLEDQPLLIPSENNAFNRLFRDTCMREGIHPQIVSESTCEANLRLLKEGMGILIEDRTIVMQHPDPDYAVIDLKPDIDFFYGLVYRDKLSRNESLFVRFVTAKYNM